MTQKTNMRLSQVARKLNIGRNTIVEHLRKKGYDIKGNPNEPINSDMYEILHRDFEHSLQKRAEASNIKIIGNQKGNEKRLENSIKESTYTLTKESNLIKQMRELSEIVELEIETEQGNEDMDIEIPFNPNDIKVRTQPLTIGDLVDRLEHNEIKMDTEFQRLAHLWNDTKKSRFIESLLLRLPIPIFYFDASDDNNWHVIDGLQRISTLESFIMRQELKLQKLEFLKQYEGKTFNDLPRDLQRRVKTFPITIYILEKGTPDIVKYTIFRRINQGGLVLTPQEIRHALHQGIAAQLVAQLVSKNTKEGKSFIEATQGKIKSDRMEDRDFATRFLSFYLIHYTEYRPDLDSFMNRGMNAIKECTEKEIEELKNNFRKAMNTAFTIFGEDAFRKRSNNEDNRKPINKALFETLSVSFSRLDGYQTKILIQNKDIFKDKFMKLHNEKDGKFFSSISQSTAQKDKVEYRFQAIENIIKKTINTKNNTLFII